MGTLVLFKGLQLLEQTVRKHLGNETVPAVGLFIESHTFTTTSTTRSLCSIYF